MNQCQADVPSDRRHVRVARRPKHTRIYPQVYAACQPMCLKRELANAHRWSTVTRQPAPEQYILHRIILALVRVRVALHGWPACM